MEPPKPPKQVIILRKDLNMRKGKMVAQGAYASMAAVIKGLNRLSFEDMLAEDKELVEWLEGQYTKVCLGVDSLDELLQVYVLAQEANLRAALIEDAGLTEFGGTPTYTAIAIGPHYPHKIDKITGQLKLL